MYPTLLDFGTVEIFGHQLRIAVHSYGTMVGLAILAVTFLFGRELTRKKLDPDVVFPTFMAAVAGGVAGAKLYYVVQHGRFTLDAIFSGSGLVWYGGLLGGAAGVLFVLRRSGTPVLPALDALAPLLLLGYAMARVGCFLAGDGDYGPPSELPWAMAFPEGVVPTTVRVHPTPLYEIALSLPAFAFLWSVRKEKEGMPGWLLGGWLVLSGIERFLAEFWRRNQILHSGLTTAQYISFLLILLGAWFIWSARRRPPFMAPRRG